MTFDIGESVKILTSIGLMKKPKWLVGKILDELPPNDSIVEINCTKIFSKNNMIRRYRKMKFNEDGTCDELIEFANKHWDDLKKLISIGAEKLIPINTPELEFNEEEKIISVYDGSISICAGIRENESIVGFFETPTWSVSVLVNIPGTYNDPPDADIHEIGNCSNVVSAAELFIETIWKEKNRSFWETAALYTDSSDF